MTRKKYTALILLILLVVASALFFKSKTSVISILSTNTNKSSEILSSSNENSMHPLQYFDQRTFYDGIDQAKKVNKSTKYKIAGGIIPHDLGVGFILADFFNRLSWQKPTTIILLGPNHYEKGNFKALSSLYSWDTPFGAVSPNESIISALVSRNLIKIDEQTLPNDHAVAGSMPFIKFYMPETKVVPILLSGTMNESESEKLAEGLKDFIKVGIVIVAPVDFSHYLTNKQAKEKDEVTIGVLNSFDYRQLFSLNNDYMDSPPSIGTFLMVMQKEDATRMDLLYHNNSGELQKNDYIPTTSFFEIAYYQ